jgi:hypothetical protein
MPATLSERQDIAFQHTVDLYRPSRVIAADGKPGPEQYTLAEAGVRCHREATANLSEITAFGRLEGGFLLTIEQFHFGEDQEIEDSWLIVDRSLRPDGTHGSFYGRIWGVRSQPQEFMQSPTREGGKKIVKASEQKETVIGLIP